MPKVVRAMLCKNVSRFDPPRTLDMLSDIGRTYCSTRGRLKGRTPEAEGGYVGNHRQWRTSFQRYLLIS